ncbi:MAG: phosphodiester glycosidase family protein [Lachnospiraceae bacterium]
MGKYKREKTQDSEILDWETAVNQTPNGRPRKMSFKKRILSIGIIFCVLTGMYLTVVYSNIPFIEKWRTIYIETAMTTNSHQWLATLFFPQSVIDEVMAGRQRDLDAQADLSSMWGDEETENPEVREFFEMYWELDTDSFRDFLEKNPQYIRNGYGSILIEDLENKMKLETVNNDALLVLDTANHLMIMAVKGDGYQGKLAIVKNPEQVQLVKSQALGSYGQEAESFGESHDALLVMNASGFVDVDGVGTGGQVKGSLIVDGVEYGKPSQDATWKFCGVKKNNRMYVSSYPYDNVSDYRWGVEFLPALIVDGKSVVDGTFGMGIQPRAAIGQTKNGDMLMLVVDGRQVGYSLGCTVEDCKNIFMRYKGYQGMNLDGGSSAVMWYNGKYITSSSSVTGKGRYMPDAFIVTKSSEEEMIIRAIPEN